MDSPSMNNLLQPGFFVTVIVLPPVMAFPLLNSFRELTILSTLLFFLGSLLRCNFFTLWHDILADKNTKDSSLTLFPFLFQKTQSLQYPFVKHICPLGLPPTLCLLSELFAFHILFCLFHLCISSAPSTLFTCHTLLSYGPRILCQNVGIFSFSHH